MMRKVKTKRSLRKTKPQTISSKTKSVKCGSPEAEVKKRVNSKKHVPLPELLDLEGKREMHRIHERQRHYSLNIAIRKIVSSLPSCGPSELETKHYILKKTSDYIEFLEEKIANLCQDLNIEQSGQPGDLTLTEPLRTFVDGFQKEIPAGTPVTMDSLEELLSSLNFKVGKSKSLLCRRKSGRKKSKSKKNKSADINLEKNQTGGESEAYESSSMNSSSKDSQGEMDSGDSPPESLLESSFSSNMICSESLTELESSGVSQQNMSTSGTNDPCSLDDGFSSSKTTDQESSQGSKDFTDDRSLGKCESLADLIKSDAGQQSFKYIPPKIIPSQLGGIQEVETGGMPVLKKWDEPSCSQQEPQNLMSVLASPLSGKRPCSQVTAIPVLLPAESPLPMQYASVMMPIASTSTKPLFYAAKPRMAGDQTKLAQQNTQRHLSNFIHAYPTYNSGTVPATTTITPIPSNILNHNLSSHPESSPHFGYINCTALRSSADATLAPVFQPVRHSVEIVLDVGPDPRSVDAFCGHEMSSKRSWINGYQLFTKVNSKRFKDGWPMVKGKELGKLIGQAWREIPDKYKRLYSQRACEWNRWHKNQKTSTGTQ